MIVEVKILYDDLRSDGSRTRDEVIRAIDNALEGAVWQENGEGWIVRK